MIIAMVCDFLGEENNGTTIFCYNLIEWLTRHGHSVNIICPDKDKSDINSCFIVPQKKHLTSIEKRFAIRGLYLRSQSVLLLGRLFWEQMGF